MYYGYLKVSNYSRTISRSASSGKAFVSSCACRSGTLRVSWRHPHSTHSKPTGFFSVFPSFGSRFASDSSSSLCETAHTAMNSCEPHSQMSGFDGTISHSIVCNSLFLTLVLVVFRIPRRVSIVVYPLSCTETEFLEHHLLLVLPS